MALQVKHILAFFTGRSILSSGPYFSANLFIRKFIYFIYLFVCLFIYLFDTFYQNLSWMSFKKYWLRKQVTTVSGVVKKELEIMFWKIM